MGRKQLSVPMEIDFLRQGTVNTDLMGGYPIDCAISDIGYRIVEDDLSYEVQPPPQRSIIKPFDRSLRRTLGHFVCKSLFTLERLWLKGSDWNIATDGGLKEGIGTCGVVMWNTDTQQELCTSMGAESCAYGLLHSTREELRGNLSAEIVLDECNKKIRRQWS